MFVVWPCGYIGIPGSGGRAAVIVVACDDDDRTRADDSLSWSTRAMEGAGVPLAEEAEDLLFRKIRLRFYKADRYDALRSALELP